VAKFYGNYGPVSQPWERIGKFYADLKRPESEPLRALVERLLKSSYPGAGLQGLTSMADLLLGMNASVLDEPHLRIRYDGETRKFLFAYPGGSLDDPTLGAKWVRRVSPDEAFAVLERFLVKRARWFRDRRPQSSGP
jgi:hypothetical protein